MRQSQTLIAIAAFATAAALSYVGAVWAVKKVEQRTEVLVSHKLSLAGLEWAKVSTNGLQVRLTGTAPTEAARYRVLTVVETAVDATRVRDAMQVKPAKALAPPKFSIELLRNADGISLIGLVPLASNKDDIARRVEALNPGGKVTDLLETADAPIPEGWRAAVDYGLLAAQEVPRSKISITAGHVQVTGISDSADQQARYETDLARAAPEGLDVAVNISAPRPVITPFTLRFLIDDQGARFDACSADTVKARDMIEKAAVAAGVKGKIQCTVGMGVPTPRWAEGTALGIQAVKELGKGVITFSDADVTLVAAQGTPQDVFDKVVGELGAKLPDVFSLKATLPKPKTQQQAQGPVEFTASLAKDGQVTLRGRLTDKRMHDAVESYAKARFGASKVFVATRTDENLPDGWPIRVLAGLEALSYLHDGSVLVQPDQVAITGETGSQDAKDQISRVLSDKLGQGQAFSISVNYVKALDPKANMPTPEQCVAAIQSELKTHKINFQPGSDKFDSDAATILDAIAAQIRKCPDVKMQVAGYTDSQGAADMNLSLSQQRAQAVVMALANRRVLVGNLVAKGFGEANPIADNATQAGREANRRIEITLLTPTPDPGAPDGAGQTGQTATTTQAPASAAGGAGGPAAPEAKPAAGDTNATDPATLRPKPRPDVKN
ncbi:MAG: OmpA family protein [Paracoccaceae bacterium]|nr:OmpA family protein [Paracoccaceae bacterium]